MNAIKFVSLVLCSLFVVAVCGGEEPFKAPQKEDYATAMKTVAAKFKGSPGVYIHIGDSITYDSGNTAWARYGEGQSSEVQAFLKWSHRGEKNDKDGWWLASVDVQRGRSHTAASGVQADGYLQGGKHGLPSLAEIIKKYNPQLALYMLGTNDVNASRPVAQYIADVEKAIDALLDNGTVAILSTLPPFRGKTNKVEEYNNALRELAIKKQIPMIDLFAEMKARAGDDMEKAYLDNDGIHLNGPGAGPATEDNLKKIGTLLRCYLAVNKGMEIKAKVFSAK
ncbi:MAG: SGNH/GDSL hydrolase family protein [Planctomycetota bacterium]